MMKLDRGCLSVREARVEESMAREAESRECAERTGELIAPQVLGMRITVWPEDV